MSSLFIGDQRSGCFAAFVLSRLLLLGRAALAAALCVLMIDQPLFAEGAGQTAAVATGTGASMRGDARVSHALNRLTFGPRPGDVATVEKVGLDRWFERQLNPASIDDSRLEARLAEYPAMRLGAGELERKYPGPGELRMIESGKASLPSDPTQRAMVEDQLAFYQIQQRKKETAAQPGADAKMSDAAERFMLAPDKAEAAGERALDAAESDDNSSPAPREEVTRLLALSPFHRMQAILAMPPGELVRLQRSLNGPLGEQLAAGLTPEQKEMLVALPGGIRMVALESMESRVLRDVYSERQLEAVMTDFWLNHFNVYVRKNQIEPYLLPSYERETIRAHALGNFEELLVATSESPAMLVYLDNFHSVGPHSEQAGKIARRLAFNPAAKGSKQASAGLNENYGRELMELHTLGVNGGYTQADVTEVAKVFTGWGLENPKQGASFEFDERRHEPGSKTVLGRTIREGGEREGLEVLHMLATNPATAHFVCGKLAVRFVSDDPPAALVNRMADRFLQSHGDIKTVLRTMVHAPEFWSPQVERAKVKTPEEFLISAVRACGAEVRSPQALVAALNKLGMPLYGMQTPNGYSWKQDDLVSTGALVSRMNFALVLSGNRIPGVRTEWTQLLGEPGPEVRPAAYVADGGESASAMAASAKERQLEQILLGAPVSDRTRATVLGQAQDQTIAEQAATEFNLRSPEGKGNFGLPKAARGLQAGGNAQAPDDAEAAVMAGLLLGSPEFQRR